jgi:cardiolipin synthase
LHALVFFRPDFAMRVKRATIAVVTCIVTLIVGIFALNFMPGEKKIETQPTRQYDAEDPQFRRSLGVLLGPPIVDGNKVDVLLNGDQIFASMLKEIRRAQRSITFETYIYWSGSIGRELSEALAERARAGVKGGKVGFTGGVGIADKWRGNAQDENHWRDTHFRVEGPARRPAAAKACT